MPAKRRISKKRAGVISPELRPLAERLLELKEAHWEAIRGRHDHPFYTDGRHQELVDLSPIVCLALGIEPWDDGEEMLRDALAAEAREQFGGPTHA